MLSLRDIKNNLVPIGLALTCCVFTIGNWDSIQSDRANDLKLRDKARSIEHASLSRLLDQDAAKAAINEGCNIALQAGDKSKYADIRDGIRIDVADGTVVCSRRGDVGTVVGGKLTGVVSGGQPKDVKEFAKRVGYGSVAIQGGKQ